MIKYSTFKLDKNGDWTLQKVTRPKKEIGEKMVDDSKYRPNQPLLRQVNGSCAEFTMYDFPDGKIDESIGRDMAFLRRRGLTKSEFNSYLESLQYLSQEQKTALVDELKQSVKEKLMDKAIENASTCPKLSG